MRTVCRSAGEGEVRNLIGGPGAAREVCASGPSSLRSVRGASDAAGPGMRTHLIAAFPIAVACALSGCAQTSKPIRPMDMGVIAHRRAAQEERAKAHTHLQAWDESSKLPVAAPAPTDPNLYLDSIFWFDPRAWHLDEAQQHAARASAHEEAAVELETFE